MSNQIVASQREKKPFDKKLWRRRKYKNKMGNVAEGQGFAEQRKKIVKREYHKTLRKEKLSGVSSESQPMSVAEQNKDVTVQTSSSAKMMKMSAFKRAQLEHKWKMEENERQRQEGQRCKQEIEAALSRYRANKLTKMKRLSHRTRKGQPIMKERMALLLEKIEQQIASEH